MTNERFFVTGALGCIGAWVVYNLLQEGAAVTVFDLNNNVRRWRLLLDDEAIARVDLVQGDITNTEAVLNAVESSGANRIVHLAGLQVPFCKANPPLGAAVNVVGTVNVFEAAKKFKIAPVAYASSMAVHGMPEDYPSAIIDQEAALLPRTHYGVYKQANEGTARIYWWDDGVPSIGLRPYIVYGPARDQGLTSAPTKAMLAAAQGESFHIPYGGVAGYQYADDVAKLFIRAARSPLQGAEALHIQGSIAHMSAIVAAIEHAATASHGKITFDDTQLPFPAGQDDSELRRVLGDVAYIPLQDGVQDTIKRFRWAIAHGRLE
jgi:nucleoside-diphosphate-sugar epimerase